ncbi:MAG: hypothetical protein AL399_01745 [Candidatus [Bacteroides] periocalifornicus]|uniref:Uncharacterized protein n=1 Tax=Candidatus [Bacteroides] periocalifornicus TaxID=1702214 RepID=A0A0Q4AZ81_9BACT|nr:MAG: hypothetical protein AL399_01745 [Candidatus [Bacteroides] periocalifornicus]
MCARVVDFRADSPQRSVRSLRDLQRAKRAQLEAIDSGWAELNGAIVGVRKGVVAQVRSILFGRLQRQLIGWALRFLPRR